jgi:hypothetical protein
MYMSSLRKKKKKSIVSNFAKLRGKGGNISNYEERMKPLAITEDIR